MNPFNHMYSFQRWWVARFQALPAKLVSFCCMRVSILQDHTQISSLVLPSLSLVQPFGIPGSYPVSQLHIEDALWMKLYFIAGACWDAPWDCGPILTSAANLNSCLEYTCAFRFFGNQITQKSNMKKTDLSMWVQLGRKNGHLLTWSAWSPLIKMSSTTHSQFILKDPTCPGGSY